MPKPRTKRGAQREERKRKRNDDSRDATNVEDTKRQRTGDEHNAHDAVDEDATHAYRDNQHPYHDQDQGFDLENDHRHNGNGREEKEFFGMLADEEQEYFRRADEMLELNQFPTTEDRDMFLESVFKEAQGKELKLASSQSCSRLMERLIQLSSTSQKKHLFSAFGGHFLSLVQHRFASHCCEALFLRSAGVVTQELAGFVLDTQGATPAQQEPEASMEELFLATLDELEGNLTFLLTDRFASHTLRVLLLVLSGRPLDDTSVRTLMKSKKKEHISVAGSAAADEQNKGVRAVPPSFGLAVTKIISDATAGLDDTGLRVMAKHAIGNPTLQLLLELDMTLAKADKKKNITEEEGEEEEGDGKTGAASIGQSTSLLQKLLPGAPKSLSDPSSPASEFINGMIYDQIGSRLIETLVQHCPGKVFKQLSQNFFLPRIDGYVRNDIACYPAIKVLGRLGKDQLTAAADKIAPTVPQLVTRSRFNVLRTLFERCAARGAHDQTRKLMRGLKDGCGKDPADLVRTLCSLPAAEEEQQQESEAQQKQESQDSKQPKQPKQNATSSRNEYAIQSHGAQLLTTILSIQGPHKAVHESLLALPSSHLVLLATTSFPTVTLLITALRTPSPNAVFQKSLVSRLSPHMGSLSTSQFGHNLVKALAEMPVRGKDLSIPLHVKEGIMQGLAGQEATLRDSWMGRSVWRSWKGDVWKTRSMEWKAWMREMEGVGEEGHQGQGGKEKQRGVTRTREERKAMREER
ncbi:Nucleolar protein 9 [Claviceps sp. LM77 group G4]|nr:Nucleolar protein 9 [Claviceps sp. LM77 group G4]KAG6052426.1 Nucleolar protein 9 [Claviceps sp. LM78 group G4]KAG6069612.1 Nucleolar protein 9 [Claviceps sp. LM84 group G4]